MRFKDCLPLFPGLFDMFQHVASLFYVCLHSFKGPNDPCEIQKMQKESSDSLTNKKQHQRTPIALFESQRYERKAYEDRFVCLQREI